MCYIINDLDSSEKGLMIEKQREKKSKPETSNNSSWHYLGSF
jgi:hypothetical protein